MLKNNFFTLIVVVIILIISSVYLYGNNFKNFLNSSSKISPTIIPSMIVKTENFTITGSNFKFIPDTLNVSKGDRIQITFKDLDGPHNLTLPDFHTSTNTLKAGQQEVIEFVANKTGSFPFYCSYGHHKEFGMTGKIIVK